MRFCQYRRTIARFFRLLIECDVYGFFEMLFPKFVVHKFCANKTTLSVEKSACGMKHSWIDSRPSSWFLRLRKIWILRSIHCSTQFFLLFFDAFPSDNERSSPEKRISCDIWIIFENSKRSKAAWEYGMEHTDHHSSAESAQFKNFSEILSASGGYVLISNRRCSLFWGHVLTFLPDIFSI